MSLIALKEGDYVRYCLKYRAGYYVGKVVNHGLNHVYIRRDHCDASMSAASSKPFATYDELSSLDPTKIISISEQEYFKEKLRGL